MSSLTIFSIASVTRFDRAASLSFIISFRTPGTICHRTPEAIDQPAARLRLASALEQRVPVAVQLRLIVAHHDDRDGVVELMVRPRGHGLEALAEQREVHDLHRARRPARRFAQAAA